MKSIYKIIFSIVLLSFLIFVYFQTGSQNITGGYVYAEKYKRIDIKFYNKSNKEACLEVLDLVPTEYLEGLRIIKILPYSPRVGHYYEAGILEVFGCNFDNINHELAHHRQYVLADTSYEITHHLGNFYKFEREIFEAMWENAQNNQASETGLTEPGVEKMPFIKKTGWAFDRGKPSVQSEKARNNIIWLMIILIAAVVSFGFIFDYGSMLRRKLKK